MIEKLSTIEKLSWIQTFVQRMREALIKEGSVKPGERVITRIEAKKNVIWILDLLAAAITGAHQHMISVQHDDIFNKKEKGEMTEKIVRRFEKELGILPPLIKDYFYCLGKHFEDLDADIPRLPFNAGTREKLSEQGHIVEETLAQLELLDREMYFIFFDYFCDLKRPGEDEEAGQ